MWKRPLLVLAVMAVSTFAALATAAAGRGAPPPSGHGAGIGPLARVSGLSPFTEGCSQAPLGGAAAANAEVEPWVAVDPKRKKNLIGVWQQDRFLFGGARGLLTGVSTDGGRSWTLPAPPPFSRCQGGSAENGGDYEVATDPWVSFGPDGDAYQTSLSFDDPLFGKNAVLVSESRDGGQSWGPITTLIQDQGPQFANDKETVTADPTDDRFVYVVWTRLEALDPNNPLFGPFRGPTYLSRTTDGGKTWEPPRVILDPGINSQTIGNQIVVLPSGDLVNAFGLILEGTSYVAVQRSADKGTTWSQAIIVDQAPPPLVQDPRDGTPVRTGSLVDVAVDPRRHSEHLYLVWEDPRFAAQQRSQIAFSKSTDGGLTWSSPKRVSENLDTQAFTPSVEVNSKGEVAVTYYDFTYDTTDSPTLDTDYWITVSADGGETFARRKRVTQASFDTRSAPLTAAGFLLAHFLGDYQGLASAGKDFKLFFVQANNGDRANPTDVYSTTSRWIGRDFNQKASLRHPASPAQAEQFSETARAAGRSGPVRVTRIAP